MPEFTKEMYYEDVPLQVTFSATRPIPAVISGPPEAWAPAEGGEVEITSVLLDNWEVLPLLAEPVLNKLTVDLEDSIEEIFSARNLLEDRRDYESDDDPFQGDRRPSGDWS